MVHAQGPCNTIGLIKALKYSLGSARDKLHLIFLSTAILSDTCKGHRYAWWNKIGILFNNQQYSIHINNFTFSDIKYSLVIHTPEFMFG